jgi:hypothetical protein
MKIEDKLNAVCDGMLNMSRCGALITFSEEKCLRTTTGASVMS